MLDGFGWGIVFLAGFVRVCWMLGHAQRMAQLKRALRGFVTKKADPPPTRKKNLQKVKNIFTGRAGNLQLIGF
jgi:hypothetical protein